MRQFLSSAGMGPVGACVLAEDVRQTFPPVCSAWDRQWPPTASGCRGVCTEVGTLPSGAQHHPATTATAQHVQR